MWLRVRSWSSRIECDEGAEGAEMIIQTSHITTVEQLAATSFSRREGCQISMSDGSNFYVDLPLDIVEAALSAENPLVDLRGDFQRYRKPEAVEHA